MVIVMEGSLSHLPAEPGFLPAIMINPGKHRSRSRVICTLMGKQYHRAGLCMLPGEDIKEGTGLKMAIMDVFDHLLVPL